jgi:NAD(P)-dependent dehydrogenase (short-subunit alcohol dehydrogenase family)
MTNGLLTYADKGTFEKSIPMGRVGSPEDMAGAALYLSGRSGAWVTGSILVVDGGFISQPVKGIASHL